jgi:hypothetical protein
VDAVVGDKREAVVGCKGPGIDLVVSVDAKVGDDELREGSEA